MEIVGTVIYVVLTLFLVFMFVRFVVDWIQVFARSWAPTGILLVLLEAVYSVTDPPIKALRRLIPPLRIGGLALDISFILVLIITYVLLNLNNRILLANA
ncbi:YggT family protein [Nocardioides sp. TRM66260-LWL]|uniref:YggT family protein n=1 Tax=Nocardioides sp. TRM66260-LWL TaxID=2874478 RepID=UPI001CC63663|nr:YggT family protein [Nocardioides sp. TRM66260-LWL]MBZ5733355.1 YggT family protein [Nocardioides sp. TRM66260-LWL]